MAALEERGVPTLVVTTEEFVHPGKVQAEALGLPSLPHVVVPHPIQSTSPDSIRSKAEGAVGEAVALLTREGVAHGQ